MSLWRYIQKMEFIHFWTHIALWRLFSITFYKKKVFSVLKVARQTNCGDYAHLTRGGVKRLLCAAAAWAGGAIACSSHSNSWRCRTTAKRAQLIRRRRRRRRRRGGEVSWRRRGWKPAIVSSGNWSTALHWAAGPHSSSSSSSGPSVWGEPSAKSDIHRVLLRYKVSNRLRQKIWSSCVKNFKKISKHGWSRWEA